MRALRTSTPHGFAMLAVVFGVGLVLYQMTALVLAAPAANRQIAIALVLPVNTSDEAGVPASSDAQIFLGTLAPMAQPPPSGPPYAFGTAIERSSPVRTVRPAPAVVVPSDPAPTDLDGVTTPVTTPVVGSHVLPVPMVGGDEEHHSGSGTTPALTARGSGPTPSRDN